MDFMIMKLKSGSKTYALKIPKDEYSAIQNDPSLLAQYWDSVLEDEKGNQPKTARQPVKKRSKSVGAEPRSRGKRKLFPHDDEDETVTNGTVQRGRKKGRQKECATSVSTVDDDSVTSKSVSIKKAAIESPEVPTSVKSAGDATGLKAEVLGSGSDSTPPGRRTKTSKQLGQLDGKRAKRGRRCTQSIVSEEIHLESQKAPVDKENVEHSSSESNENVLPVKDKKTFKQPVKAYGKGLRKDKEGVGFQSSEEDTLGPVNAPVSEDNVVKGNSGGIQPVPDQKTSSEAKTTKEASRKGVLPDHPVTQSETASKKRGWKRKPVEIASKEHDTMPEQPVGQDESSDTTSKDISVSIIRGLPSGKSNEKQPHGDTRENQSSSNVLCRRSARQKLRQQKPGTALSPDKGSVSPETKAYISDSSKSGESGAESQLKMAAAKSPQKLSSVSAFPEACVPESSKLVASPVKTFGSTSQTVPVACSSESSMFVLQTSLPQGTTVTPIQVPPGSSSPRFVAILPGPRPIPTAEVTLPASTPGTILLSSLAQGVVQQTFQQPATQNLTPSSISILSLPSVTITPSHPATPQLMVPKVVSQNALPISTLQNITQAVTSPFVTINSDCQLVQCVQPPCVAQNEVVLPQCASEPSSTRSPQATPVKKVTLKEFSAAVKKSSDKISTPFSATKGEIPHDLEISEVLSSGTKTAAYQDVVGHDTSLQVIAIRPMKTRRCVQSSKSPVSVQSKGISPAVSPKKTLTQNEVISPAITQTSIGQQNALEHTCVPVAPAEEVSVAIKKFLQKTSPACPTKAERPHGMETSLEKVSPVKSLDIKTTDFQDATQQSEDKGVEKLVDQPMRKRGRFSSPSSARSQDSSPVLEPRRKLCKIAPKVPQQHDVCKMGSTSKSPEVKQTEVGFEAASSGAVIQKGKLPQGLSGVNGGKSTLQLTKVGSLSEKTENLSLHKLRTDVAKKLPLKLKLQRETVGDRLESDENVVQQDKSAVDNFRESALSDKLSVVLVPINIRQTSSDCTSKNDAGVNQSDAGAITQLLSDTAKGKKRTLSDEGYIVKPLSGKYKLFKTKGGPLKMESVVQYPLKTAHAAASAKRESMDLSDDSNFKIIHPVTPVQPPIFKKLSREALVEAMEAVYEASNDNVASPKKAPKTSTKEVKPQKSPPQPEINQANVICKGSPREVPNVSSSPLQPHSTVQSEMPFPVVTPGTSKSTELQPSVVSPQGLNAFETLLNEGLDSVTQILAQTALACKKLLDSIREQKRKKTCA